MWMRMVSAAATIRVIEVPVAMEYHAEKGGSPQLPDAMDSCLPLGSMSISDH